MRLVSTGRSYDSSELLSLVFLRFTIFLCLVLQRKQKEVAKENDFYYQMMQQALPAEQNSLISSSTTQEKTKGKYYHAYLCSGCEGR